MKTIVTIQFDFPRDTVLSCFGERLAGRIDAELDEIDAVTLDADDPDVGEIRRSNVRIEGRRLIRLIRSKTVAEYDDGFGLEPGWRLACRRHP